MKIVLHVAVDGLGRRGDIVSVADGYARNYLIPRGVAHRATDGVEAQASAMRRSWDLKNAQKREAAEEIAKVLVAKPITIPARAGVEGKLFGSVTAADVATGISEQTGVEVDRKMVDLENAIRATGTHMVDIRPHPEVQFPVAVTVTEA